MKELREEGLIGAIGLSNVTLDDYPTVRAHVEVACAQNADNLASRGEQPLLDTCQADGVPFVRFFPLGSSFAPESPVLNAPAVREPASRLGAITAQVALAWLLAQVPTVLHTWHFFGVAPGGEPGRRPIRPRRRGSRCSRPDR
jgi:pyridoxine 4-dehydrogenase